MTSRIKFFRDQDQAQETLRFLNSRRVRSFIRQRTNAPALEEETYFFDLFVLKDEDVDRAKKLLEYEYGSDWGESAEEKGV